MLLPMCTAATSTHPQEIMLLPKDAMSMKATNEFVKTLKMPSSYASSPIVLMMLVKIS